MRDVFEIEKHTLVPQDDSYIISYPHIASYMELVVNFTEADFVRASHMVYGWMPTVLELYPESPNVSLSEAACLLQKARERGELSFTDLESLAKVTNNSIVGASKLLHFTSPDNFAIWDSKIYSFIYEEKPYHYRVSQVNKYIEYIALLNKLKEDHRFQEFHHSVNQKVGYAVSPLRSLELVMFRNAPVYGG